LNNLESSVLIWKVDSLPKTIAHRTRRAYDRVAAVYSISTLLFHSVAHRKVLSASGGIDGMCVLEVATGSGEMFRRLVRANRTGETVGFDLSPNMAARTRQRIRREFPKANVLCQAVDARQMPFRPETFDVVFCCYLFELLSMDDIVVTLAELYRVLKPKGKLAMVCIGENTEVFNRVYKVLGKIAPAFWGRQVEERLPELIEDFDFQIVRDEHVRQGFYPSRVLIAHK
jgi:ubiquinone/menaquinone biosynthesis C-methylase UbiE